MLLEAAFIAFIAFMGAMVTGARSCWRGAGRGRTERRGLSKVACKGVNASEGGAQSAAPDPEP